MLDHRLRSNGVGSSEIAMLVYVEDEHGDPRPLSPWGGRHKLWRRKTGKEKDDQAKQYMTRGQYMEKGLIDWYAADTGVVWLPAKTMRHPDYPYVVDSCDALTWPSGTDTKQMKRFVAGGGGARPLRCVEAKTSSWWKRHEWGEPGTDDIPSYYLVQAMWHLGMHRPTDMICDVPMDNGTRRADYHVDWDEELWLALVSEAERFWIDFVKADKEPPIDDAAETTRWLSRFMKQKDGQGYLEANGEQVDLLLRYREIALSIKDREGELEAMKEKLMRMIGEHEGIQIADSKQRITWRRGKDKTTTDWKSLAHHLIDLGEYTPTEIETLSEQFSRVREGSRSWVPTALLKN